MRTRIAAALELVLLFPAALFLAAVVPSLISQPSSTAHSLVMWYAERIWTLWILLLALPLIALVIGCATLWRLRPDVGTLLVAAGTLAAGGVLVVVILHMLAN